MALTTVNQGLLGQYAQYTGFKNLLINGAMVVNQYNDGSSFTPTNSQNIVDRFRIYAAQASKFTAGQNQGSVTPPAGFVNYIGFTSASAYTPLSGDFFIASQWIEGYNIAALNWGTFNAQTITLSFWVRSSLTGTFSFSFRNGALDRSYVTTYTISAANTWEYKTITVPGDTSGTWLTTTGRGCTPAFDIGSGSSLQTASINQWISGSYLRATGSVGVVETNGATFQVTGVQIEKGSTATSFDYRPYGTELQLCQRYAFKLDSALAGYMRFIYGSFNDTTHLTTMLQFPVKMRTAPSLTTSAVSTFQAYDLTNSIDISTFAIDQASDVTANVYVTLAAASGTQYRTAWITAKNSTAAYFLFIAEL